MSVTVLFLTPLALEYQAVSRHLTDRKAVVKEGAAYETGRFQGRYCDYTIVVREPGMRNTDMALATERAIQHWSPEIAILCGIAGGIKDLRIGDVAIAKSAFNYDSGKESEDGFLPRPVEYHFSEELLAYAQLVQRSDDWKKRTVDGAAQATVHLASVAAGDKVVAAVGNATYERVTQFLSHCKFLEMEAAGFGLAVQRHRKIHAMVVRGISDMCKAKSETDKEEENWQERAAERASAVGMEVLFELNANQFITTTHMDIKDIVKGVYDVLFPAALKEISSDFADAVNGDIRALWQRVKPIFIEEVKELASSPGDADAQADVRNKLKKAMEADAGLKEELEGLLGRVKKVTDEASISVVNSKNVIAGSSITVGGDFRVGDSKVTNNVEIQDASGRDKIVQSGNGNVQSSGSTLTVNQFFGDHNLKPAIKKLDVPNELKETLHNFIQKAMPEQALDHLAKYSKMNSGGIAPEILILSDRWQDLSYKIRMGIISHENSILNRNQIVNALVEIIQ